MIITLSGATGFIGTELVKTLHSDPSITEIRVFSRSTEKARTHFSGLSKVRAFAWNPSKEVAPATALEGTNVVIHLAGENVGAGRWSPEVKKRIRDSRELGTRNLVTAINTMKTPPVLVSTSATGFYGSRGDELLEESSSAGTGFLSEVCQIWEAEAKKAKVSRLTILRIGVVIGEGGGMLGKLLPLFKAGLGGKIGNGKHWLSWIDRHDLLDLLKQATYDSKFEGVFNACAPNPVTNSEFTETLGAVLHRPTLIPVPEFGLRLAFGEMADQTILSSQRVISSRLTKSGFGFKHPTLRQSLQDVITPAT